MKALTLSPGGPLGVDLLPDAIQARDQIIASAEAVTQIQDELDEQDCVDALKALRTVAKQAEESRVAVKRPVDELVRQIQSLAASFVGPVEAQIGRLNRLLTDHQREKERLRQEELQRQREEQERLERERREAEALRLKAAEDARKAAEAELLAATPQEAQQAAQQAQEAQQLELTASKQVAATQAAELKAAVALRAPTQPKPEGLAVRRPWKYEVTDLKALYAARPELCRLEENASAINAVIRAGARELPGLRIWQEIEAGVRT